MKQVMMPASTGHSGDDSKTYPRNGSVERKKEREEREERESKMHNSFAAESKADKEKKECVYLDASRIFQCTYCKTHLFTQDEIISKSFHGKRGRAFLLQTM